MIDVSPFPMTIGVAMSVAPEWGTDVLEQGRDAAFLDTGYLLALFDDNDGRHGLAKDHWARVKVVAYTSPLVLAEVVRQLAKSKSSGVTQDWRWDRVTETKRFLIDEKMLLVCAPPREVVEEALSELEVMQRLLIRLDLCDALSMVILRVMQHRRVFGFDGHFNTVGASLEPGIGL